MASLVTRIRQSAADLIRPARPLAARAFEAASGRRCERIPPFGRSGPETLAATGHLRDRARHAVANDPLAANAVAVYQTGLIGAGITAASGHPNPDTRKLLDNAFRAALPGFPA